MVVWLQSCYSLYRQGRTKLTHLCVLTSQELCRCIYIHTHMTGNLFTNPRVEMQHKDLVLQSVTVFLTHSNCTQAYSCIQYSCNLHVHQVARNSGIIEQDTWNLPNSTLIPFPNMSV